MIDFTATVNRERYPVTFPNPDAIPVASVAKAAVEARDAAGNMRKLHNEWSAAIDAVEHARADVKRKAADLAIKKKDLPKDIRKSIKDAEEVAADLAVAYEASEAAFVHAYDILVAEVNANRPALEAAALIAAEQSLERMALARKAFENAAGEAWATYGLLGMFRANDEGDRYLLKYRDPKGSRREVNVSLAREALAAAVSHSALELESYKRGSGPTKKELEAADNGEE